MGGKEKRSCEMVCGGWGREDQVEEEEGRGAYALGTGSGCGRAGKWEEGRGRLRDSQGGKTWLGI